MTNPNLLLKLTVSSSSSSLHEVSFHWNETDSGTRKQGYGLQVLNETKLIFSTTTSIVFFCHTWSVRCVCLMFFIRMETCNSSCKAFCMLA